MQAGPSFVRYTTYLTDTGFADLDRRTHARRGTTRLLIELPVFRFVVREQD